MLSRPFEIPSLTFALSITTIPVLIFLNFLKISYRSGSPQVKRHLISSVINLAQELLHKLPNDLTIRILSNWKMLEKYQIWVET